MYSVKDFIQHLYVSQVSVEIGDFCSYFSFVFFKLSSNILLKCNLSSLHQCCILCNHHLNIFTVHLYRICRLRTGHIASVSRMRCVYFVCAPLTAWRRRSWLLQNTSWTWTRRSSRLACLTRSLQDMSAGPFYRLFWNMRSRMRSELHSFSHFFVSLCKEMYFCDRSVRLLQQVI